MKTLTTKLLFLSALSCPLTGLAWTFGSKADLQFHSTDNVNSTADNEISDTIRIFNAYLQTKDESNRFRLRFKLNRFEKTTENDSNLVDLSYQKKFGKNYSDTFQAKIFREKYSETPVINTDTNADNRGAEFSFYLANTETKNLTLSANYLLNFKDYTNDPDRQDTRLEATFGAEKTIRDILTFAPDAVVSVNKSKAEDYSTFNYGANLFVGAEITPEVELFFGGSLGRTSYLNRLTLNNREKEQVTTTTLEAGLNYYLLDWLTLEGKLGTINSSSNEATNSYKAREINFGLSFQY